MHHGATLTYWAPLDNSCYMFHWFWIHSLQFTVTALISCFVEFKSSAVLACVKVEYLLPVWYGHRIRAGVWGTYCSGRNLSRAYRGWAVLITDTVYLEEKWIFNGYERTLKVSRKRSVWVLGQLILLTVWHVFFTGERITLTQAWALFWLKEIKSV